MKPVNPYAFPTFPENHGYKDATGTGSDAGMTLRDHFAGLALQGEIASQHHDFVRPLYYEGVSEKTGREGRDDLAAWCYKMADAMLKARQATKEPEL